MSYELKKPITGKQRSDFIVEYNHNLGMSIEDTEMYLFALEKDEIMGEKEIEIEVIDPETGESHVESKVIPYPVKNPEYPAIALRDSQEAKYMEANQKANDFLQSGEALFEFEEGKHIEATDGNIAKMNAYLTGYILGQLQPEDTVLWNTKEDETVHLTQSQIGYILVGLGQVQSSVWAIQYSEYVRAIEEAETAEEVEAIEINYIV